MKRPRTLVGRRYKTEDHKERTASIGKVGVAADPKTGSLWYYDDEFSQWRTSSPCCDTCGELLGTSRPKWGPNRWPATVNPTKCEHCGASICEQCATYYRTSEVLGMGYRLSEGRHKIPKPIYRHKPLCPPCAKVEDARLAAIPKQPSAGTVLLRSLDLLRQDEEI